MQVLPLLLLSQDLQRAQGPDLTRYFAVLGGVVLILVALAFGLRKLFQNSGPGLRKGRRSMQVVEVLSLGSRRQLAIVRCFDRTFALGLGEKSVSLVAELDAEMVQHETKQVAPTAGTLIPKLPKRQRAATQALPSDPDPFEALLVQAQAQLEARRRAEQVAAAKAPTLAPEGLQELC